MGGIFLSRIMGLFMDFADYFYGVNYITTMNFSCDAPFIILNSVQHSVNRPINPCNPLKSFNP